MKKVELRASEKAVLNVPETAAYINVAEHEIRRLCKIGVIQCFKVGRDFKIPRIPLIALVEEWGANGVQLQELRHEP